MPVFSIGKLLPLGGVDELMHYCTRPRSIVCIRSSTAPRGNSFDYTAHRHDISVYYIKSIKVKQPAFSFLE